MRFTDTGLLPEKARGFWHGIEGERKQNSQRETYHCDQLGESSVMASIFFWREVHPPLFFLPFKTRCANTGSSGHRPPNGAHADAFSHCSRADSRPDRAGSGHSQVAQDLADIRTRGERLQLSVRATPTAGAGDRSNGANGLLVEAAAAPPDVSWTPAAAATARLDRFDRQMIIATHLAHRSDVVRRAKHCCAQRSFSKILAPPGQHGANAIQHEFTSCGPAVSGLLSKSTALSRLGSPIARRPVRPK